MSSAKMFVCIVGILIGVPVGIGGITLHNGEGLSYLSNNPQACVNCHIMKDQYDSWMKSSHKMAATCNDCHTPGNFLEKYFAKASNGFWHSWAFTTGRFREPIRIKRHNRLLVEKACRTCHQSLLESSNLIDHNVKQVSCLKCHTNVAHNR